MDSNFRTLDMSKLDLFFYEELSIIAGREVGSKWLTDTLEHGLKKRKSISDNYSSNKRVHESKRSGTLDPATSLDKALDVTSDSQRQREVEKDSCETLPYSNTASSPRIHVDSLPMLNHKTCSLDDILATGNSNRKRHDFSDQNESNLGLIFTDAAHVILD